MPRLNEERQKKLEPDRIKSTISELERMGIQITFKDHSRIEFRHKGWMVKFYPYSGWHTGKTIKDGRGFKNLLKQIK